MNIPVLVCGFRRPNSIRKLLSLLESFDAQYVFIHLDGIEGLEDSNTIQQVEQTFSNCRLFLSRNTKWLLNFEQKNLGLKDSMQSALDWFFSSVSEGVILEDDCNPSKGFFEFASLGLRLVNEEKVGTFGGTRFTPWKSSTSMLSLHTYVWGWGTNRQIWSNSLKSPEGISQSKLIKNLETIGVPKSVQEHWKRILAAQKFTRSLNCASIDGYSRDELGTALIESTRQSWDYTFVLSLMAGNMISDSLCSVRPAANLVRNIGFGADSTNFLGANFKLSRPLRKKVSPNFKEQFSWICEAYEAKLVFGISSEDYPWVNNLSQIDPLIKRFL